MRRGVRLLVVLPVLVVFAGAALLLAYAFASVPLPSDLDIAPTVVYDVRGERIGELQQQATREDIALGDLPGHVTDAVLAAEDARFYEHRGVSLPGIVRAAYTNVLHGEIRQGGSTVSQQYVKNLTGAADDSTLRKLNEAVLAVKLERQYDKDRILEMYLNSIYFGRGAYGIQAAAQAYFAVDAEDLSPEQAALLAGIIPAPSAWDPERDPVTAGRRYGYVLRRLGEEGWAGADEIARMTVSFPDVEPSRAIVSRRAPFFLAMVERELSRLLGAEQVHRGLTVGTSLDLRMQDAAERAYREAFDEFADELAPEADADAAADEDADAADDAADAADDAADAQATLPTGALVALDPATGGIRALVGGPDYAVDQYNLAVGGPAEVGRQAGSTFKVFGLAAWVEEGYSPESLVDAPAQVVFSAEDLDASEDWAPRNYGDADLGTITLREATWHSSNTAYAQLALDLGPDRVLDVARRAGVDPRGDLRADPALVLGTGEVTPLRLAESFNTFASGGRQRRSLAVLEVSRDGQPLVTASTDGRRVLDEEVVAHTSDVLQGVLTHGTGTAAALDRPAAGKTGTTSNHADAWFAGYTPDLTAAVWMGHRDDNQPMAGSPTGGGLPARLWAAFMSEALEGVDPTPFPEPSGELALFGEEPECPEGEALVAVDPDDPDGEQACVPVEATEEPTEPPGPTEPPEPTEDPDPEPAPEPTDEPAPDPEPPEPTEAPPVIDPPIVDPPIVEPPPDDEAGDDAAGTEASAPDEAPGPET